MSNTTQIAVAFIFVALLVLTQSKAGADFNLTQSTSIKLLENLSFYNNFDNDVNALFSTGEHRPINPGLHFKYSTGIVNNGLLVGQDTNTVPPQYLSENNIAPDNGTLSLWFKPDYDSNTPISSVKNYRWLFSSRGKKDRFYLQYKRKSISLGWYMEFPTLKWKAHDWKHIVITWTKDIYTMYLDGMPVASNTVKSSWGSLLGFGEFFTVGGYLYKGQESANGVIDEIAIWNRTLNDRDVKLIYNLGKENKPLIGSDHPILAKQATTDNIIKYKLNALENGSFEAGISNWLLARIPKTTNPALPSIVTSTTHKNLINITNIDAYHGKNALRLHLSSRESVAPTHVQNTAGISTLAFPLDQNKKQEAYFWIRSESDESYNVKASLTGMKQTEIGDTSLNRKFIFSGAAGKWNLVRISGLPGKAHDELYRLNIVIENTSNKPTHYDIDAINIAPISRKHDPTYKSDNSITGTISTNKLANIFSRDESIILNVKLANQGANIETSDFTLNVFDFDNNLLFSKALLNTLGSYSSIDIFENINLEHFGIYRATLNREDLNIVDNITLTILPDMQQHSSIGIHTVADDYSLSVAKRLGIYWHRLWDNGRPTSWTSVQPVKQDEFNWKYSDDIINKTLEHGLTPIGIISWPVYWERNWVSNKSPSWIHKQWNVEGKNHLDINVFDDPDFLSGWKNYVQGVITHYVDKIQYWELLNEPYQYAHAEWVNEVYKVTAPIIKNANKNAIILGPSTHIRQRWTEKLISLGILDNIDIFSYHGYDMSPANLKSIKDFSSQDGKIRLIFDTENSGSTSARLFCDNCPGSVFTGDHDYKESTYLQIISLLQSLGEGTNAFIYYWMVPYDAYNKHRSFINYDGTLRSTAAAFAITGWLLGDIESATNITSVKGMKAYLYNRKNGTSIASIWKIDTAITAVNLEKLSKDAVIRDLFGNAILIDNDNPVIDLERNRLIYIESQQPELMNIISDAMVINN